MQSSNAEQERMRNAALELADAMSQLGAPLQVRTRVTGMMVPRPGEILYRYGIDVVPTDDDAMKQLIEATQAEWLGERPGTPTAWRPIGTAPRDGTGIIVGMQVAMQWVVHRAWWCNGDEPGIGPEDRGWWSHTGGSLAPERLDEPLAPTHWMPMPLPPLKFG